MEGKPLYSYEDYIKAKGGTSDYTLKRAEEISKYFRENPEIFEKLFKEFNDKIK